MVVVKNPGCKSISLCGAIKILWTWMLLFVEHPPTVTMNNVQLNNVKGWSYKEFHSFNAGLTVMLTIKLLMLNAYIRKQVWHMYLKLPDHHGSIQTHTAVLLHLDLLPRHNTQLPAGQNTTLTSYQRYNKKLLQHRTVNCWGTTMRETWRAQNVVVVTPTGCYMLSCHVEDQGPDPQEMTRRGKDVQVPSFFFNSLDLMLCDAVMFKASPATPTFGTDVAVLFSHVSSLVRHTHTEKGHVCQEVFFFAKVCDGGWILFSWDQISPS